MNRTIQNRKTGRILLVAPLPPPVGGDTVSSKRLLESRYWKEAGYQIECVDTSAGGGVKTADVRRTLKDPPRAARILAQLAFGLAKAEIMLLWANSSFIVSLGIPVMRMARTMRKPYLVKPFGTMLAERLSKLGPLRRRSVISLLNGADHVLPQTRIHAEELVSEGIDRALVTLFPNFLPDGSILGPRPGSEFSGRCVFIGQIKEEKGIFDIFEALGERDDLSCDFYGQIVDRDRDRFFDAVASGINCRYRGMLSGEEIVPAIARYDVLLLPTTHPSEGYPAVVLEAFAAGVPVIATEWKAIPELVADGERGLLVPPSSPARITEALDLLRGDRRLCDTLVQNAREFVSDLTEERLVGGLLVELVSRAIGRSA
jgi:glycosyltransferase involved in cell wall biosynthesis